MSIADAMSPTTPAGTPTSPRRADHSSADAAASADELAGSATQVAQRGGQAMHQVVSTMEEIRVASARIGDIVATIDAIARGDRDVLCQVISYPDPQE